MTLRGREVAWLVGAVLVAGVCVRLGVWQLGRLGVRRARNAEIRAARERPALEITGARVAADSVADRRVVARGVYDYGWERLWRARTYEGMPGVHLVTPLRVADGSGVLVDRGWVPSPDAAHVDQARYRGPDTALVEGFGVLLPRGPGDVDPARLRDSVPYPLASFGVQELAPPSGAVRPRPPLPIPPRSLDDGPHRFYAIQWFSFAIIALVGTFTLLRKADRRV